MPAFESVVDPSAPTYLERHRAMSALVDQLHELRERPKALSEKRRARFEERGQLTPRDRLNRLLDPGMPFLELFGLANYGVDTPELAKSVPGGSSIAGIGFVSGTRVMVLVDDSGINAGAITELSVDKAIKCLDIALAQKLPLVHLVESAGADLMNYKVELWARGGGMFYKLAKLSAAGLPTLVVLHGPSTAGGAYMPGMSDYVIGVKGRGRAALGGAALVQAATGEVSDEESLSGSQMHASTTGLVEYLAEDDVHALELARNVIGRLDWSKNSKSRKKTSFTPPRYDIDQLLGIVPVDYKLPYDAREVVARIVDDSQFLEFKPSYGPTVLCLQAHVFGMACHILANNGPIDPNGATKAAQFIQLADQSDTPLIFLNNITGYMVGLAYEQAGMIKHGSKMIQAVSNARVPKVTLYIGASFGAGNYGMCGLAYEPDFLFAWPNAMTGVMGGEQAAKTMTQVMTQATLRRGQEPDADKLAAQEQQLVEHFDSQSDAFYTSGRLLDNGVIDPRDSRKVIAFALQTCAEARGRVTHPNTFGVARL